MAINRNGQATKYKFLHNGKMLKKGFHNSTTLIWSAGSTVTYKVDTGVEYTEEVDSWATCLTPKTFTPTKDGWTFVGWREDETASGEVLDSKVMDSEHITLYAVFKKDITVTYYANGASSSETKQAYYNNGNNTYPTFTYANPTLSGASFLGWSTSSSSTTVKYSSLATATKFTDSITLYAVFKYNDQTVEQTGTAYKTNTKTVYIDADKYEKLTLNRLNYGNTTSAYLLDPDGNIVMNLYNSATTASVTSFVTGNYTLGAGSNYNATNTAQLVMYGKTIVG